MLAVASNIIAGARDQQYGGPEDSFTDIAALWSVLFGREFSAGDVAVALMALKLARIKGGGDQFVPDNWVDIAGYAACGYEVEKKRDERKS